ncbi:hypothetical protein XAP6164_5100016 [Xanthomonas phaseoli pv. phaseoli]|nr:hypothetical protein XAP6164_5100016 [Xanthomonas phaseoli pv. phaseoli]
MSWAKHQVVTERQIPGGPGNVGISSCVATSVLEQLDRAGTHALLRHRLVRRAFPLHAHVAQAVGHLGQRGDQVAVVHAAIAMQQFLQRHRFAVDRGQAIQVGVDAAQRLRGDVLELQGTHRFGHAAIDRACALGDFAHAIAQRGVDLGDVLQHGGRFVARLAGAVHMARGQLRDRFTHLRDRFLGAVRQLADLLVEGGGALGQVAHLVGDHREAATGFTGTCCFDGGVQGQQVGLVGDRLDVFQQREDAVQVLRHLIDVMDGVGALTAHLFQRFHQLLHAGAGMLGEAGDVDAGAAIVTGAVDDAGQCLALLTRFAVHRFEAATQAGHGLADQFAGTLDFRARSVDFVADKRAQFVEQLILLAQDAGLVRIRPELGIRHPGSETQPTEGHGRQDRPAHRSGPVESDSERKQQGQSQRGG